MVYCKLNKKQEHSAVYDIGTRISDMTGTITFYDDERYPDLNKQAERFPVRQAHIARLYNTYHAGFEKGEFPDKLAVEIG